MFILYIKYIKYYMNLAKAFINKLTIFMNPVRDIIDKIKTKKMTQYL